MSLENRNLKAKLESAFENRVKNLVEKTLSGQGSSASGYLVPTPNPVPTPKSVSISEVMIPTPKSETDFNGKFAR